MSTRTMKAAVRHEYGPPAVLRVEEIETPNPDDDEVLIRVHAASVNLGDWELLTAEKSSSRRELPVRRKRPPDEGARHEHGTTRT